MIIPFILFFRTKKSTKKIIFSLDIFVFRAILVHINSIPEATTVFFWTNSQPF